ncbi:MAG: hypothetical protein AAF560_18995 [Acidobacteriota bacterium]
MRCFGFRRWRLVAWSCGLLILGGAAEAQVFGWKSERKLGFTAPPIVWAEVAERFPRLGPQVYRDPQARFVQTAGFAARKWPIAVKFELEEKGVLLLRVLGERDNEHVYFKGRKGRIRLEEWKIPRRFSKGIVPAEFLVTAYDRELPKGKPIGFTLHGLGVGKRAVGSLVIEDVTFGPSPVTAAGATPAEISLQSKTLFDSTEAHIWRQTLDPGANRIETRIIQRQELNCPRKQACRDRWDLRDDQGQPSIGNHGLSISAWFRGPPKKQHWTYVDSDDRVVVQPE